jgi:hypothetical protein
MFEAARKATIGTLRLTVEPPDAAVTLDGAAVAPSVLGLPMALAAGTHRLAASRGGYRAAEQEVQVAAGAEQAVTLALERVSSRIAVVTSPPDVEVTLDGVPRGRTPAGPPPATYADTAARLGVAPEAVSAPLFIDDVATGVRLFEFRRPCYQPFESRRTIERPADLLLEQKLDLAAAIVKVESNVRGAEVVLNGQSRGPAPQVLPEVCEGPQVLEVMAPVGRYIRRFEAHAGETVEIAADVAPALALVSAGGEDTRFRGEDVRLLAEQAIEPARSLTVFVPPDDEVATALREQRLPADWLAVDATGQPVGQAGGVSSSARRDASAQLARRFAAQGVAGITSLPGGQGRAVLALLAAGSSEPDAVELPLGGASMLEVIRDLDAGTEVLRRSIDATVVDVADVTGAVIVAVAPGGQAAGAGLALGDAVVAVDGVAVADAAAFERALAGPPVGRAVTFSVADLAGNVRSVPVAVVLRPRLVSPEDRMTRFNKRVLDLRFQLTTGTDPTAEAMLRLNLGAALVRLGNWSEARRELQRVKLAEGPGISNGTVQYLLGLAAEGANQPLEADQAFKAAAASEGATLTEYGPLIADLLKQRTTRRP